jgi:uncharacterized RDD family membrane protein YckC
LSTSPIEANLAASWKKEVNRRLEEHKNRKGGSVAAPAAHEARHTAASRAAQSAAERVAARYANAPSYSQMLAEEARSAVRAAEAASRAALDLQAAAESVLAGLEAASAADHARAPETFRVTPSRVVSSERAFEMAWEAEAEPARPTAALSSAPLSSVPAEVEPQEPRSYGIRWDADLPSRPAQPVIARAFHGPADFDQAAEGWWEPELQPPGHLAGEAIESVEPMHPLQPMHANLIEFPRELVATRKMRPRRAEGPYATGTEDAQLSIFEVDPGSISIEPEAADGVSEAAAPSWQGAEWSDIRLGEQPMSQPRVEVELEEDASPAPPVLELAPFGLRVMAAVVDGALITGAFLAAAMVAATHVTQLPALKGIAIGSALALVAIGALYNALFLTLAEGTPGMKYAHIALCTFGDEDPSAEQRRKRLVALMLSLLPVGLGLAWAIFDEDHLTWHDRLSGTYLRRY